MSKRKTVNGYKVEREAGNIGKAAKKGAVAKVSQNHKSEARLLELSLNKALADFDYQEACRLSDVYIDRYKKNLSYKHLVIIAEVYLQCNFFKKAHALLMDALRMDAESVAAPEILFWVYHKMGDSVRANQVLSQLLEMGPEEKLIEYAQWEALRGNVEADQQKVIDAFHKTGGMPEPQNPRYHELMFSYLMALCSKGRADEASAILDEIPVDLKEKTPNLPMIEGQIARSKGLIEEAIALYTGVYDRFNQLPEARWNRALCHLESGNLDEGWDDYLHRFEWSGFPSPEVLLDAPRWNGELLDGKTILLWAEQGIGDQILFLTAALPLVRNPNIDVMIAVHPKLVEFVSVWYPEAKVLPLEMIDSRGVPEFRDADYQLPFGDLPCVFLKTMEQVNSRPVRFMRSPPSLRDQVFELNNWNKNSKLVGICWRSSHVDVSRLSGYIGVKMVESLRNNLPDSVELISLQYRLTASEIETLRSLGVYVPDVDFFNNILAHGVHVGICDYVVTPATLTKQLAGLFDVDTLTWDGGGWSSLGQSCYPWYRSIATLELSREHSLSSLSYQIGRWLNIAIENDERSTLSS